MKAVRQAFHNGEGAAVVRWFIRVGAVAAAFVAVWGAAAIIQRKLILAPIEARAEKIEEKVAEVAAKLETESDQRQLADSMMVTQLRSLNEGQEDLPTSRDLRYIVSAVAELERESERRQRWHADSLARAVQRTPRR